MKNRIFRILAVAVAFVMVMQFSALSLAAGTDSWTEGGKSYLATVTPGSNTTGYGPVAGSETYHTYGSTTTILGGTYIATYNGNMTFSGFGASHIAVAAANAGLVNTVSGSLSFSNQTVPASYATGIYTLSIKANCKSGSYRIDQTAPEVILNIRTGSFSRSPYSISPYNGVYCISNNG